MPSAMTAITAITVAPPKIHGVTQKFIDDMAAIGYDNLDEDELVSFRIHGVNPAFVRQMEEAGFGRLDADELLAFRIHGINARYVRKSANWVLKIWTNSSCWRSKSTASMPDSWKKWQVWVLTI